MRTPAYNKATDKIREAVDEARSAQMTPEEFIRETWTSWEESFDDDKKHVGRIFRKVLP